MSRAPTFAAASVATAGSVGLGGSGLESFNVRVSPARPGSAARCDRFLIGRRSTVTTGRWG
jgi:hypothetical protein